MLTVLAEKLMFIHVGDGNRPSGNLLCVTLIVLCCCRYYCKFKSEMSPTYHYALLVATSGKAPEFGASRLEQLDRGGGVVLLISTYNA